MYKIIDLDIEEALSADTKVEAVALVNMPAIETEFVYFNEQKFEEKTFRVTNEISANACKARRYKDENRNTTCGTNVGWTRSSQLCEQKPISLDTVKRMYSYLSRHKVDLVHSTSYDDGCGLLMYDAWGGKEALEWSKRILQRELGEFDIDVNALPDYDYYPSGETKGDMLIQDMGFIEKLPGEGKNEYIGRCIAYHVKEKGMEQDQAAAVCYSQADEAFNMKQDFSTWDKEDLELKEAFDVLFQSKEHYLQFEAVGNQLLKGYTQSEIARFNHKNPTKYYLYKKVVEPKSADHRDFCKDLEGRYFRRGQIYGLEQYNKAFGHNRQAYDKWLYKGGPQCIHAWEEWSAVRDRIRNDGMVPGTPGIAPQEMVGAGYYPGTPRYEANLSSVCTECNDLTNNEKNHYKKASFKGDTEKRMLYSPLMIPNILIPRVENGEKYFVRFTREAVERIQRKFMIEQKLRATNLEHNSSDSFEDMVMVESWIVNGESDKAFTLGYTPEDIPVGTWMVGYKVLETPEGDDIWNNYIKNGKVKGLSAEGAFLMNFSRIKTDEYLLEEIINIINQIN